MKLYHGSKSNLVSIRKNQAAAGEGVEVPADELLDAIYLTPDYGFALACAARPRGVTQIDHDKNTIIFGNPESFNPDEEVFVHEVDIKDVPKENIKEVDERQYAVVGIDELEVSNSFPHKARDVRDYYKLENWQETVKEIKGEPPNPELRMR